MQHIAEQLPLMGILIALYTPSLLVIRGLYTEMVKDAKERETKAEKRAEAAVEAAKESTRLAEQILDRLTQQGRQIERLEALLMRPGGD